MLRAFTADYIHPVSSPPVKNGVVVTDDTGKIIDVLSPENFSGEYSGQPLTPESHRGIICPGFINAHCHLELSHLKGAVEPGNTLPAFIGEVIRKRSADHDIILKSIATAEAEMIADGIVGVGDICNTADTVSQKKLHRLRYHNFIELFDIVPEKTEAEFERGLSLLNEFRDAGTSSLTPHAPYTVTPQLLKRISDHAYRNDSLLSMHNQETESENAMFTNANGALFEKLSRLGELYRNWKPTGFSSLSSTLVHLPRCNKTLLVHNTYSTLEDINWAHLYSSMISWCFCPNANLFIEKHLPDFKTFADAGCKIAIGTDSYAGNRKLSVLEEIKTISSHCPEIKTDVLLRWATLNGAEFFGWKNELGSLEKNKRPGLNLISDISWEGALTATSGVMVLI